MQVSVESIGNLGRKMTVRVPTERISEEVQKRLRGLSKRIKMDGFRPGKVPFKLIEQRYGAGVYQDVVGEMMQTSFREAVTQEQLSPAGSPQIELGPQEQEGELAYVATFEVYPQVALNSLAELSFTRPVADVTAADVDRMLETLRKQRRTWETVDRAAAEGDQIVIDFKGLRDGVAFEGGQAEDHAVVLGEGRLIESFESQLYGLSAGDEKTLDVVFPTDYQAEDLAGQTVQFEIKVKQVNASVLPVVDDEFASAFGVTEGGVEALRAEVRGNMERELQQAIKARVKTQVMDALAQHNPIELPKALVQDEIQRMRAQIGESMSEDARANLPDNLFEEQAQRRVSLGFIVGELVRNENIQLDPARVDVTLQGLADGYEEPEEVVRYYRSNREAMASIEALVLEDQVVDHVLSSATVQDEALSFDEIMNADKKGA
ncbi:trigger factor [Acidihalobacter ferrooxydans]|uniref:Trigger factor n=1 Tax=Acidihalobacter ferrooxydans TaxID=1765967 RepID=A0A1P8UIC7_9GAMM|nr:trigger factor [Acidihalobacter ferrooxydans]APZ43589.1 trigger factor [Acidihalobacter ferrooxydans]